MPDMEQVEMPVGENELLSGGVQGDTPRLRFFERGMFAQVKTFPI